MIDLRGQAAVVTGSSSGVGRATALELARRGCDVLVHYCRSRPDAEALAAELRDLGVRTAVAQGDVADDAACRALIDKAVDAFGRLDILVNNAGTTRFIAHSALEEVTDEVWQRIMDVNVKGSFQCIRAAREAMIRTGAGHVVNVASVAGIKATGSSVPYAASKAAVINMTISLARALSPTIRVNAVAPGFIAGRWLEQGLGLQYDTVMKRHEDKLPLQRVSTPEDVADAIVSLLTGSRQVTGQTLPVDGGMLVADF
ncbi:MAG: SDR family oxidoreductase [Planctomycetia bacterium]|nr:SDR family oxidoreductase [Planctomycetia bacterium]